MRVFHSLSVLHQLVIHSAELAYKGYLNWKSKNRRRVSWNSFIWEFETLFEKNVYLGFPSSLFLLKLLEKDNNTLEEKFLNLIYFLLCTSISRPCVIEMLQCALLYPPLQDSVSNVKRRENAAGKI